jgi:hypothetical protein
MLVPSEDRSNSPTRSLSSVFELAPVIGQLRDRHDLNMLGTEVLAAAVHLGVDVYLSVPSPRLEESLRREARAVQILAWTACDRMAGDGLSSGSLRSLIGEIFYSSAGSVICV